MRFKNENELDDWLKRVKRLWLLLDYDGTLAEFTERPDDIKPRPEILSILERITHRPETRIAITSGRQLEDLQSLLPMRDIYLIGTYGIQVQTPTGLIIYRADYDQVRPALETLKPFWQTLVGDRPGFYLEDKGWALALHARFAAESDATEVLVTARKLANDLLAHPALRFFSGDRFFEVAPRQADKGKAISFLLERFPWENAQMVYCGDDDKDEEAFRVVHRSGGIALWVLHDEGEEDSPEADYVMGSAQAMRDWLEKVFCR